MRGLADEDMKKIQWRMRVEIEQAKPASQGNRVMTDDGIMSDWNQRVEWIENPL